MVRLLVSALLHTLANALGLLVASAFLPDFTMDAQAFVFATILFTIVEVVAGPLIVKLSIAHVPALTGGVALVTTLVGLIITSLFVDGLSIEGFGTWAIATLIVWLAALLAGLVLPLFMFKKIMEPEPGDTKK